MPQGTREDGREIERSLRPRLIQDTTSSLAVLGTMTGTAVTE